MKSRELGGWEAAVSRRGGIEGSRSRHLSQNGNSGANASSNFEFDAVIIGAGMAGLYMLHRLRSLGLKVRVYEAGSGIGGTWFWNRYPGARCDVESLSYSYSFSGDLQQSWRWPDRYAIQADICAYLRHVADRFALHDDIQLNTRVVSQVFEEDTGRWLVRTDIGDVASAQFCIMATGNLSTPRRPAIAGLERFKGRSYHSGLWPAEGVDFTGKRVALIGTGATGVQMAPKIAPEAKHLYVFQRTANFSIPARNAPLSDEMDALHKANYDQHRRDALQTVFGMSGFPQPTKSALAVTPEERARTYEERWRQGGSINFLSSFTDLLTDREANETAAEFVRQKIRGIVQDPETAELLCPKDHPIGAKRLCVDTDYYETFNRPNVTLLDARSDPIQEFTPTGVRTRSAEYQVDSIVFATGFDAMTGALLAIDVRGRGGVTLAEKWRSGPAMYLGLMVSGFPNMFVITGPGSPSVKANMFCAVEQHVDWITECVSFLRSRQVVTIEADKQAEQEWVEHVSEVAHRTLYPQAESWYSGSNVPGKPHVFMPYVGGVPAYNRACEEVVAKGYKGFVLGGAQQRGGSLPPPGAKLEFVGHEQSCNADPEA